MSTSIRKPLADALKTAEEFQSLFDGCYERWEIAGSIRRRRSEIGDVEHCVIPLYNHSIKAVESNLLWLRLSELINEEGSLFATGQPLKWHIYPNGTMRRGSKYRGVEFQDMLHEIFILDESNWGSQLVIRTGPADFSREMVIRLKYRDGKPTLYQHSEGYVTEQRTGNYVHVPTEERFFELCGMRYVAPERRDGFFK